MLVTPEEAGQRLDRWLRQRFPHLPYGTLAKWLRTGQLRVGGCRAKPSTRLEAGQELRLPPARTAAPARAGTQATGQSLAERELAARELLACVIYEDDDLMALNKPAGLAVQGGSGVTRHLDRMLPALARNGVAPKLVHRLDRDTSGLLLLARSAAVARQLTADFRDRAIRKTYWALVQGVPARSAGRIDLPLARQPVPGGERIMTGPGGKPARTVFTVIADTPAMSRDRRLAWLALHPLTGRTHQIRVHCAALGIPVVGDRKYGAAPVPGLPAGLHLHARGLRLRHPGTGRPLALTAPLTGAMAESWTLLGLREAGPA